MIVRHQNGKREFIPVIPRTQLKPPPVPRDARQRSDLIESIRTSRAQVVHLCAPAGWGKTTLLAQWRAAELDDPLGREICWLTFSETERTAHRFLAALTEACRIGCSEFGLSLAAGERTTDDEQIREVVPIIIDELAAAGAPVVIMIDDLDLTSHSPLASILGYLIRLLPPGVQLALATSEPPPLPLARLRTSRELIEIRADRLRFDLDDVRGLAATVGVGLGADVLRLIMERTEGWPVGVMFILRAVCDGAEPRAAIAEISGHTDGLFHYLDEEFLSTFPASDLEVLAASSILDDLDTDVVEEITGQPESAAVLARASSGGGYIEPVDRIDRSFRFHPLVREALARRLEQATTVEAVQRLHERAAETLADRGAIEQAIGHAVASGEPTIAADGVARRIADLAVDPDRQRTGGWLAELDGAGAGGYPPLALAAALFEATGEDLDRAGALLAAAERERWSGPVPGGWSSVEEAVTVISAAFLDSDTDPDGVVAERTATSIPRSSPFYSLAQYGAGRARFLAGDAREARVRFNGAVRARPLTNHPGARLARIAAALAAAHLAILSADEGRHDEADEHGRIAMGALDDDAVAGTTLSAVGDLALGIAYARQGRRGEAMAELTLAEERAPRASSVRLRALIELVRMSESEGDVARAKTYLAEAESCAARIRGADWLRHRLGRLITLLHGDPLARAELVVPITDGEMAVLRQLPTNLTQREIAQKLSVSINTVKSHLRSIYSKLGVSSRPAALTRARALGLLLEDWAPSPTRAADQV